MSLREQWYAARQQREQEIHDRQQEVMEHRQRTVEFISDTTASRAAMAAALRDSLSNFHSTLQANVAAFREETRSQHQKASMEQAYERAAYIAALQDYVWGTTPTPGNIVPPTNISPMPAPAPIPAGISDHL